MFNPNPINFGVCLKFNLFFVVVTFYKTLYSEFSELFAAFCVRLGRRILVNGLPSLGEKRGGDVRRNKRRNNNIVGELSTCTYTSSHPYSCGIGRRLIDSNYDMN